MDINALHIDEENTTLLWGLVSVIAIATATYMLSNAFMAGNWSVLQLISIFLFSLGIYGIIRLSTPLLHFVLCVEDDILKIEIWQEGDTPKDIQYIPLYSIQELRIAPHTPRDAGDALFDFSTSYHLVCLMKEEALFRRLIEIDHASFTLKVDDIKHIIHFLHSHNPSIIVPEIGGLFHGKSISGCSI